MPRVVHFEIHAEKPARAIEFYQKVFGWEFQKWEGPIARPKIKCAVVVAVLQEFGYEINRWPVAAVELASGRDHRRDVWSAD